MSNFLSGRTSLTTVQTADIADNAITLAKMASGTDGQVLSYDASGNPVALGPGTDGQVLTSTGAGSPPAFEAVGGAGKILEVIPLVCDGSSATGVSGSYTSTDVTAVQNSTQTYADLTGSSINYTPPSGTSAVIYEFQFLTGYADATAALHIKLFLAGTEVTDARTGFSTANMIENRPYFKWVFRVGDGDDAGAGKVATWSSGKIIKLQVRDYSSATTVKIHETAYWDGTGGSHVGKPVLTVTAID